MCYNSNRQKIGGNVKIALNYDYGEQIIGGNVEYAKNYGDQTIYGDTNHAINYLDSRQEIHGDVGFAENYSDQEIYGNVNFAKNNIDAYQAIEKSGAVDYDECFQCLDCVVIYESPALCVPLILADRSAGGRSQTVIPIQVQAG